METVILILLIIVIIALAAAGFAVFGMIRRQSILEEQVQRSLSQNEMAQQENRVRNGQLDMIGSSMERISEKTSKSTGLVEQLSFQMQDITEVMSNAKRRGNWGEFQLDTIIRTYLGDSLDLYENQYRLKNGRIADGAFHLPATDKVLCIDSKFPAENYLAMIKEPESEEYYRKEFRNNIKKHVGDVADKYITEETIDVAMLFVPSEAIYQYICAECADLQHAAMNRHVMLVSPTTLAGVLFTYLGSTRDFYRSQNMEEIEKRISKLELDAARLCERTEKETAQIETALKTARQSEYSARKLADRIKQISSGDPRL